MTGPNPLRAPFADQLARMCELYGINPTLGRLYAVLFTETTPMALEDLAAEIGAARSTASVAMRRLVEAGVVERLPPRPDRRDWYVAITDLDEIVRRWNARYFGPEVTLWRRALTDTRRVLDAGLPPALDAAALDARFSALSEFVTRWATVLEEVLEPQAAARPSRRVAVEFTP